MELIIMLLKVDGKLEEMTLTENDAVMAKRNIEDLIGRGDVVIESGNWETGLHLYNELGEKWFIKLKKDSDNYGMD